MTDDLFGTRVIVSKWISPGCGYVIGEFEKPEGWESMTKVEQAVAAIRAGAAVIVHDPSDMGR